MPVLRVLAVRPIEQVELHGDPRKVTGSWQRSPLHAAGACISENARCNRELVLLENLARRHPGSLELMREIGALKNRGYTNTDIAAEIDFAKRSRSGRFSFRLGLSISGATSRTPLQAIFANGNTRLVPHRVPGDGTPPPINLERSTPDESWFEEVRTGLFPGGKRIRTCGPRATRAPTFSACGSGFLSSPIA